VTAPSVARSMATQRLIGTAFLPVLQSLTTGAVTPMDCAKASDRRRSALVQVVKFMAALLDAA